VLLLARIQIFLLRARVFSKSILKVFLDFLEITRDNLTSTSVEVVPLTVTSTEIQSAPDNIAVRLRYSPKTADLTISANAHFCVFSVFCWQLDQYLSYSDEPERELKPVTSSIVLWKKLF